MSRDELQLLAKSVSVCRERMASLQYSVAKNSAFFPLTLDSLKNISEDQKESIDAMILRYSQCVSMIQDQLFKGIAIAEQEDINDKSNRDKTLLMEKLGAIKPAAEFGVATVLRNKFAHHYPEESRDQIDKLNCLIREAGFVSGVFDSIIAYIENKRLLSRDD